jgi:hypothetical protein
MLDDINILWNLILWIRDRVRERWTNGPTIHDARREFMSMYPQAQVRRVYIWESVRTAKSYYVKYWHPDSSVEKEMKVQFMPEGSHWILKPTLPPRLP